MSDEEQYKEGYPKQQGWFDVLLDGEPERLRHWICQLSGRHEWIDIDGQYIRGREVLWIGEPSVMP
jgi:hypothetical protein